MRGFNPFSKRNAAKSPIRTGLHFAPARTRLLLAHADLWKHRTQNPPIEAILEFVENEILRRNGYLARAKTAPHLRTNALSPIMEHYYNCTPDEVIDFLEYLFRAPQYGLGQEFVDEVNDIFRQEDVGVEFSPFTTTETVTSRDANGEPSGWTVNVDSYPIATKKTNELIHSQVVMPVLQLLAGKQWSCVGST